MNAHKIFRVGLLEQEEAWGLFKQIASVGPDLQSVAIEVAKECQGLPVAISMVARALKDKSSLQWRDALQKLKGPSEEKREVDQVIHSALKLSYYHLRSEELKLTFSLCYVLGHNTAIEDLWKYGMALSLFNDTKTIAEARERALALVFELKNSSLLLDSYSDKFFDVHDVVCDFALSIASDNHLLSVVKYEDIVKCWSDGRKIQYGNVIILQNAYVDKLPSELNCPQLKIFYMSCKNHPSLHIPKGFFCEMRELRVLHMSHVTSSSLPSSIGVLANLRKLCLHQCFLDNVAIIGQLQKLEILSLSGSDIEELSCEIGNLTQLRLLDLNNCTQLRYIPPRTLSRLSRLEELYMTNSFRLWGIEGQTSNASLVELKELSHLTCLEIEIRDLQAMPKEDLFSGRLLRYKIYIGYVRNWTRMHESSKTVKLEDEIPHHLDVGLKELINETEELCLHGKTRMKNLQCIFEGLQSFQHLKKLHLYGCYGIEYIFNPMEWNVAFSVLESLSLSYLYDLKNICHGIPEMKLFDRLRIVRVEGCGGLENLFSFSLFRNILQLQEIEVADCNKILEVVAEERLELKENSIICNVVSLRLQQLPRLISFSKQQSTYTSPGTKALFNEKIMFPSLEYLQLSGIGIRRIWQNQLATTSCFGQNLRNLIVEGCHKLQYLWSDSMAGCFVQLKRLQVTDCGGMKTVIQTEEKVEGIAEAKILFPQLISLRMQSLPNLQGFYLGNLIIEFPTLKEVIVEKCPKLYIFSKGVLSAPKLRNIGIGEDGGIWPKDLNATVQKFYKDEKLKWKKKDETERGGGHSQSMKKGETESGAKPSKLRKKGETKSGDVPSRWRKKGETEPKGGHIKSRKKGETGCLGWPLKLTKKGKTESGSGLLKLRKKGEKAGGFRPKIKAGASGTKEEEDGPETAEVIIEADAILSLATKETATTPVKKPLSATERENLEIVPDENKGTMCSHEIETEDAYSQKEEYDKVVQMTENVSQSSEPEASTGVVAITTIEQSVSKILECMDTETVRRIVVHGVCGVGKSSVLGALVNTPKIKNEFELIIWVTVSKYWSPKKIREQIIQQLPPASSNAEPFQILMDKKFLLLLDDVWEWIDLQEMGIPDPSQENGSMIILATRELKVCHDMEDIRVVEVEHVSKEEAWKLFHEQVGGLIYSPSIQHYAQGIVERCCGLPLLIIVTGRALAGEMNVPVWQHAFNEFSVPGRDIISRIEDLIQLLKFSFDRLKSQSLKSCFLYCALFSEDDQEINTNELIEYCIQEGLIAGCWPDAYERGYDVVNALLHALFLETTKDSRSIRIRDVMRNLALGILSQEEGSQFLLRGYSKPLNLENHSLLGPAHESPESNRLFIPDAHRFILRAGSGLTKPPSPEEWEKSKMIFLMDNKLSTLPERPNCPDLLTLFLQRNFRLRVIPISFFDCMPCLKVLNLSNTRIKCLPKTISKLISLETLILCHCERLAMLPSDIGSLKLLQILDLRGTEINILPDEIGELASLKYLDVCFCGSIDRRDNIKLPQGLISSGIISSLHALESLGISVCPGDERWNKCVDSITDEVSKLKKLTSLSFYFPELELLKLFLRTSVAWIDQRLTKYKIVVGHDIKRIVSRVPHQVEIEYGLMGQCLRFVNGEKIPDAIVEVLARCSAFYLDHHLDISSISEFGIGNISKLKYCILSECPAVKAIVGNEDFTEVVFPCLEHLNIHHLWNLEYIWEGVLPKGSFAMLRTLHVHACPKLKYVFKSSMLQYISNLEELIVDDCTAVEKIILDDMTTELSLISYSNFKKLTLHYLPALDNIWEVAWPLVKYINVYCCPNFKKINLDLELKHTLKEIKGEKNWWDGLEWKEPSLRLHFEELFTPVGEDA